MSRILFWLLMMFLCSRPLWAAEVRVFAAASMKEAVTELCTSYAAQNDVQFITNFAASGTLARQMAGGAPADLYISANPKWMDYLEQQGVVAAASRAEFAFNELVFVADEKTGVQGLNDLERLSRLAIGSPKSVPAGAYAEQTLRSAGLYDELLATGRLVFAKDVRQALMYADRGEVEGAFVYRSDALLAQHVGVRFSVPPKLYPRVTYPLGMTVAGASKVEAKDFARFLQSPQARDVLIKYGFSTADQQLAADH